MSLSPKSWFRNFPFWVAVTALVIYLATLCHGVTPVSAELTARVAGWDWQPLVGVPVFWLLTLPLRLLPSAWMPWELNLFSALGAAMVLGILVRTVELLPWPRPLAAVKHGGRYLPALLAVVVCGWEFSFWRAATSAGTEILDTLMLAVPIWCLLEFRVNGRWGWLRVAVVVWGMGMAQNWMMFLALPFFVIGIFLLRPLEFLNVRYLLSFAGWGLAGFSIYVVLPLWNGLAPGSPLGFGEAWLVSLRETKQSLSFVYHEFWSYQRLMGIAVGIFYLTPVLACLIRLHDEDMENKSPLDQAQIWLFRGLRAALLLAFLWLALDPVVGPRGILWHHLKVELPLLSFDYLCGLAAGYLAGTTLLASLGTAEAIPFMRLGGQAALWLERGMLPIVAGLVLVTGGLLVERNLPVILTENRESPLAYGELAVRSLPAGGGIVLSDFPEQLAVFQAALARRPDAQQWLPVETQALAVRQYRKRLAKRHPGDWQLAVTNADGLSLNETLELFNSMVSSNRVFYLHTGFGSYCEFFYLAPVGSLFELKRFTNSAIQPPALSADVIAQNEKLWDDYAAEIGSLQSSAPATAKPSAFEKTLHLEPARSRHPAELREWLSVALDAWGVALQREGNLPAAGHRFEQALAVNPDNWIANANLFCNTNLAAKAALSTDQVPNLTSQFGNLQTLLLATAHFGPPDEPNFCLLAGAAFEQRGLLRQALQQYQRANELAPDTLAPQLALVPLYLRCHLLEPADQTIARLEDEVKTHPEAQPLALTVALFRANLCLVQTNFAGARAIYQKILQENPGNTDLANTIGRNYMTVGDYDDANNLASELLAQHPEDIQLMQAKSGTLIKSGHPAEAMTLLDHILAQTNTVAAQLNHAMAQFQTGHYDAARNEYLALQATTASPFIVDLGLAETSLRLQDTNQAAQYFTQCLSNLPPESPQAVAIRNRLLSLQAGGH